MAQHPSVVAASLTTSPFPRCHGKYCCAGSFAFLADTLPTILNSPAFQTQRSAIFITWDEDYNNLSLGIGNEGDHVPMIVIPSPNSGMRQGHIVAAHYNDHYSLLRTIEDSLQLPRLTNNDKFAQSMNEYWQAG